jgi:phosphomannomutase
MNVHSLRLGTAGMRGRVGTALTPALAMDFASALGTYLDGGSVVVACDTRFSSDMFRNAAIAALTGCGCDVRDAGVASAPELHFLVPHLDADAGLLIGGGHHPAGWNALVPLARNGAVFNYAQLQELLDVYHSNRYRWADWRGTGQVTEVADEAQAAFLDAVCAQLDVVAIRAAKLTVVADFCNGSGTRISTRLGERLGINLVSINTVQSGVLPHSPEPRPRSSQQVQSLLGPLQADIGFVFNSDMSRAALVTSSGETLSEEYTFPLVTELEFTRTGKPLRVVTNCCTTRTLDDVVARHGGELHKTKVGESYIIDRMVEIGADLAGDGSGSTAFGDHILGFDYLLMLGVVLEALATQGHSSADLAEHLPRYHIIKRSIACPSAHAYTLLRNVRGQFGDAERSEEDGFRFDWPDGWVHLRASMTEPIIRMIVEWKTREEAEDKALYVRGMLERLVAV